MFYMHSRQTRRSLHPIPQNVGPVKWCKNTTIRVLVKTQKNGTGKFYLIDFIEKIFDMCAVRIKPPLSLIQHSNITNY